MPPYVPGAGPRSHRDTSVVAAKVRRLHEPHIAPLTDYVERWRQLRGDPASIPYFDPAEAGVNARILLLLEAPGSRAVGPTTDERAVTGSGFVSADNDDQTAANTWTLLAEAGVDRQAHLATWNVIPWYLGNSQRIRPATVADIDEARPAVEELVRLLPVLRVVVLLGRNADKAWKRTGLSDVPNLTAPHPSPRNLNGRPTSRDLIRNVLSQAVALAHLE